MKIPRICPICGKHGSLYKRKTGYVVFKHSYRNSEGRPAALDHYVCPTRTWDVLSAEFEWIRQHNGRIHPFKSFCSSCRKTTKHFELYWRTESELTYAKICTGCGRFVPVWIKPMNLIPPPEKQKPYHTIKPPRPSKSTSADS